VSTVLVAVRDRLEALDHEYAFDLGRPNGPRWTRLDDIDARAVRGWLDQLEAEHRSRAVAASYLAGWCAAGVVGAPMAAMVLGDVVPLPMPDRLWLRRHPGGWFDRSSYDDALAVDLGRPEGAGEYAAMLVEALAPAFGAIRSSAPYGNAGLWGAVADAVANATVHAARRAGLDAAAATPSWRTASSVVERVAQLRPELRARPRPFLVRRGATVDLLAVRSVCCLAYRSAKVAGLPDDLRYCVSCPLVDDDHRARRLVRQGPV
jgi:hypothetical protein